jgi:hypothetical protein
MPLKAPVAAPVAPEPVVVRPDPAIARNDDFLHEAAQTTKEAARREQILKENYLKAEQRASHMQKESYQKDLQLSQFFLQGAIEDGDAELQAQMHGKISELQSNLVKHDMEYDGFLNRYQNILDDKLQVMDYTPTDDSEPTYQESPTRQTFRKENGWYDYEASTYNENLVQKANEIEQKMLNEYQLKNMNNYLETPYYFEDLKARLFNEFGIQAPAAQQPQQQYVAPQQFNPQQQQSDWQSFQHNQQNQQPNQFVPEQVPQFNNGQNPYPAAPVQQNQQQYGPQVQAPTFQQSYGPPTAPVNYGRETPQAYQTDETMFSQKAFEMFQNSLNPTIAPQLAKLSQAEKMQLFNAAIKSKGR